VAPEDGYLATAELEEGPSEAWHFCERGKAHAKARRWKDAIADYTRAILLEPDEPEFWLSRGIGNSGCMNQRSVSTWLPKIGRLRFRRGFLGFPNDRHTSLGETDFRP
jgi:hypothetical protein